MQGEIEIWSSKNEWLNTFAVAFTKGTRRMLCDVVIEADDDCVVICGSARSYYAVQLAIHCVQTYGRVCPPFAMTRLSLEVEDHSLELSISHRFSRERVGKASARRPDTRRELTFA